MKAHRLLYHSTLGLRVIKKKKCSASPTNPLAGAFGRRQGHPLEVKRSLCTPRVDDLHSPHIQSEH